METPDYSAYQDKIEDDALQQLRNLAQEQIAAERAVAEAEKHLLSARKRLEDVAEDKLPALMDSLGLETFTLTDGHQVEIKEKIRANIPKAQEPAAFEWIRGIGSGRMIKRQVIAQFAMGEDEVADTLVRDLTSRGLEITDKQGVHNSTLVSFVRRRLEAGEEVPLDKISVFRQRVSKVK